MGVPFGPGLRPFGAEPQDASQAEPLVPNAVARRLAKLIHPQLGIKRGIIDRVEPGKGSPDRDDKMIPISIGEIREAHAVLTALAAAIEGDLQ